MLILQTRWEEHLWWWLLLMAMYRLWRWSKLIELFGITSVLSVLSLFCILLVIFELFQEKHWFSSSLLRHFYLMGQMSTQLTSMVIHLWLRQPLEVIFRLWRSVTDNTYCGNSVFRFAVECERMLLNVSKYCIDCLFVSRCFWIEGPLLMQWTVEAGHHWWLLLAMVAYNQYRWSHTSYHVLYAEWYHRLRISRTPPICFTYQATCSQRDNFDRVNNYGSETTI